MLRIISSIALLLLVSVCSVTAQTSKASAGAVNSIGPYKLGASYTESQFLPGFKYDSGRSKPEIGIKVGKIIDTKVYDQATIQRLTFHKNKLVRVSIIMGDPNFTEDQAKALVSKQWGDPGPKQNISGITTYVWTGSTGTVMLLPADGGRQMITLTDNDRSHFVE